jgi:prepilin signal peptidase PulO-like enzyme (type II secretory pathway)
MPVFMTLLVAVLGLVIGSFLNVVIYRLRTGERGSRSRSICPLCHHILQPRDLVPLVSFALLGGKCRSCKGHISWQYPLVEATVMVLFLISYFTHAGNFLVGGYLLFLRDVVFVCGLVVVFVIDFRDMVVFDSVTLPLAGFALLVNALIFGFSWQNLLLAMAIGGGFFLLQWLVSRGRWIGGGDVRIGAMMGAMLGFPSILVALFLAYIIGAIVAVYLLVGKKTTWQSHMAFGTFLTFATVVALFAGKLLLAPYVGLF